jgi:hypothetical protein
MRKVIYLPDYAKKQFETSDDSAVWSKPVPFKEKPERGFTCKIFLNDDDFTVSDITKDDYFYPVFAQNLDDIIERMEFVKPLEVKTLESSLKRNKKPSAPGIYRRFLGNGGDAECWAKYNGQSIEILLQHSFSIFSPDSYFRSQERVLDNILEEAAGIIINRQEIMLPDNYNYFDPSLKIFSYTSMDKASNDGKTYKLFAQHDGGRGWSVLTVKAGKRVKVLMEDHNDNVRDYILNGDFLKENGFNINLKYLMRYNVDFYKSPYKPTREDFIKDFHIDEKGKIKKA